MNCLDCGATNLEEAHHCVKCGASLRATRAQLHLDRAQDAIKKGRFDLAKLNLGLADVEMLPLSKSERDRRLFTAQAFWLQSYIYYVNGQMNEAQAELELAVANLEQQSAGKDLLARAVGLIGTIHYYRGDIDEATRYYERSSLVANAAGEHMISARTLTNLGIMYVENGEIDKGQSSYARALEQAALTNDYDTIAEIYRLLAWFHVQYGPFPRALEYAEQAYKLLPQVDRVDTQALILGEIGGIHARSGNFEQAEDFIHEAHTLAEPTNNELVKEHVALVLIELVRQSHAAKDWYGKVMRALEGVSRSVMMKREVDLHLAHYYAYLGNEQRIHRHLHTLAALREEESAAKLAGQIDHAEAVLHAALGEWDTADELFQRAQQRAIFSPYERAAALTEYAQMLQRRAEVESQPEYRAAAHTLLAEASKLFQQLEMPLRVAAIEAQLGD